MARYYGLSTLDDLADTAGNTSIEDRGNRGDGTSTNQNNPRAPTREESELIKLLINSSEGGITTKNLIEKLNDHTRDGNSNAINNIVRIYYDTLRLNGSSESVPTINDMLAGTRDVNSIHAIVNASPNCPTKTQPGLSVIEVNHVNVVPSVKNVNAVTLFMNSIPSVELSRALPYVNIEFQYPRPPVDNQNRISTMTLLRFLEGSKKVTDGSPDRQLAEGSRINTQLQGQDVVGVGSAGMELFTSPQTLVNANKTDAFIIGEDGQQQQVRAIGVLDKFRPFLTLKNLTIEVQAAGGLMSFKTGKLEFVLHDKSRLAEIADFISPNLYGLTELMIEYGWIHPDTVDKQNVYGDIINSMRSKEKYGIVNSSFSFDDNGQVNVILTIAMRGGPETSTETIADSGGADVTSLVRMVETIERSIGEIRNRREQNRVTGVREIRGIQILNAAADARSNIVLSEDMQRSLREFQTQVRTNRNPDLTELRHLIGTLYGQARRTTRDVPLAVQLQRTVRTQINRMFSTLTESPDPFLLEEQDHSGQSRNTGRSGGSNNNSSRTRISLGKLLLACVGKPLAATGKFDDVQLIFYPFNGSAGRAHNKNIAQFSVDKNYFINQYAHYRLANTARSANISIREFLSFVATTILDDNAAEDYGLQAFRHRDRGGAENPETVSEPRNADSVATQNAIDTAMRAIGITEFKMPQVDFYFESIPEDPSKITDNNEQAAARADDSRLKTILRIHVYDKRHTSYESSAMLLDAMRNNTIMAITTPQASGSIAQSRQAALSDALQRARDADLIGSTDNGNGSSVAPSGVDSHTLPESLRIKGGPAQVKDFIMKTVPYFIHGAGGTAIKKANLSSMQDPALTTVNLLRSFRANSYEPFGERPGGLPLQIIPCQLDLSTFGCPMIDFGQQFFVDFNTNTTVDHIYGVGGLTHTIGPGKFETEIKMFPIDTWGKYVSLIERLGGLSREIDGNSTPNDSGNGSNNR